MRRIGEIDGTDERPYVATSDDCGEDMKDSKLTAIPTPPSDVEINFHTHGPLKPRASRPDLIGDENFECPHCGMVLVEGTTTEGVRGITRIQCYSCERWSSGTPSAS